MLVDFIFGSCYYLQFLLLIHASIPYLSCFYWLYNITSVNFSKIMLKGIGFKINKCRICLGDWLLTIKLIIVIFFIYINFINKILLNCQAIIIMLFGPNLNIYFDTFNIRTLFSYIKNSKSKIFSLNKVPHLFRFIMKT